MMLKEDLNLLMYVNEHLVKAVQWQDHPDIYHDDVKLGGELSIFFPTWKQEIVIPNGANAESILQIIDNALNP